MSRKPKPLSAAYLERQAHEIASTPIDMPATVPYGKLLVPPEKAQQFAADIMRELDKLPPLLRAQVYRTGEPPARPEPVETEPSDLDEIRKALGMRTLR